MEVCKNEDEYNSILDAYKKLDSEINEELIEALCVFVELDDMIIRILDKIELPVPYCSYFEEIIKKYNKIT